MSSTTLRSALFAAAATLALPLAMSAQAPKYTLTPALDLASIDKSVDPCNDFYKYACGNFAANHPIPSDQPDVDEFYTIYNVNTERLNNILLDISNPKPGVTRTPNQQKVGDYYAACMNTDLIEKKDLAPIQPLFAEIDKVSLSGLPYLAGELNRLGVNAFLGFGEIQDFKDSTKQVAFIDQGGLGLPERDYYTRTGEKDVKLRKDYVEHLTNMLSFLGESPQQALVDANNILAFETKLAEASMTNTERRDPLAIYHPQTMDEFEKNIGVPFDSFFTAVHSPTLTSLVNGNPKFFSALAGTIRGTDMKTIKAYLKYQVATAYASQLPKRIDAENFHFNGTVLSGQPEQRPRWKRCSSAVDGALGEALGQVYVEKFFAGDNKAKVLQMVGDIEGAMDKDIDTLEWMSPATKAQAKVKLHAVANKIGYPDHWRDYSKLSISAETAFDNLKNANAFENDRQLAKIGQPVDKLEWGMTPPTVNAYYDPSMNNINFPAGILESPFFDASADTATNYGHMGGVIGHELTHGFDDQGAKFDDKGNMKDWWTPEDKTKFEARTGCLEKEYGNFIAVDDVKINGKLTLGENTADNGGAVLAYLAYLDRAKKDGLDVSKKIEGYTGPQRFYLAWAQNWCENSRPEITRQRVQTDGHSPDHFRANGVIVNQPGFAAAFGCKKGTPMVPTESCRVW